eukprot:TRINITY_DN73968_c0_g1_i1.p1 TRINITY_DN73968_c0_g1~~TRINITY_DN73968_c0_g1_i1.p1  ORF type:complete len:532 (+),score=58.04 TRINITY_DN73968_c0_g1_i1:69-1598(+)
MALPEDLTALSSSFPTFGRDDIGAICFNLRRSDMACTVDPFFHWQGVYIEVGSDACPIHDLWSRCLPQIAKESGTQLVREFCSSQAPATRMFWMPAKGYRWGPSSVGPGLVRPGCLGPDGQKTLLSENVLVRYASSSESAQWALFELSAPGQVHKTELPSHVLLRITYPFLTLSSDNAEVQADPGPFQEDMSECAWVMGSTLIRLAGRGHEIKQLPSTASFVRYVPLAKRNDFLSVVAAHPAFVMTGATLSKDGCAYQSPVASEVNVSIGEALASRAERHGIHILIGASMAGHDEAVSADRDLTLGFGRAPHCEAVHFKGSNAVLLHGDGWNMQHGTTYLLEEAQDDFSNNAKEAAMLASLANPRSAALLSSGGGTVAKNLIRFLCLASQGHVFTISGVHNGDGRSGASAPISRTIEEFEEALRSCALLSPEFFSDKLPLDHAAIVSTLKQRPLTLLDVGSEGACAAWKYFLEPGMQNDRRSPGLAQSTHVSAYANACAEYITDALAQS